MSGIQINDVIYDVIIDGCPIYPLKYTMGYLLRENVVTKKNLLREHKHSLLSGLEREQMCEWIKFIVHFGKE